MMKNATITAIITAAAAAVAPAIIGTFELPPLSTNTDLENEFDFVKTTERVKSLDGVNVLDAVKEIFSIQYYHQISFKIFSIQSSELPNEPCPTVSLYQYWNNVMV